MVVDVALHAERTDEIGLQHRHIVAVEIDMRRVVRHKSADLFGRKHLQRLLVEQQIGALRIATFCFYFVRFLRVINRHKQRAVVECELPRHGIAKQASLRLFSANVRHAQLYVLMLDGAEIGETLGVVLRSSGANPFEQWQRLIFAGHCHNLA